MLKKILSLIFVLLFCFSAVACGDKPETTASTDSTGSTGSTVSNVNTENEAILTITVGEKEIKKIKSDRPYDKSKKDISLILVAGQSNFHPNNGYPREYGYQNHTPEAPTVTSAGKVYSSPHLGFITALTNDRDMVKLCDTSRGRDTFGGVSPSFGAQWSALTNTTVVFVQAALGGVGMHEWVPNPVDYSCPCENLGKGEMYTRAVENFTKSYEALSKNYNIVYMGYIWNQGEHENDYNSAIQGCTICSDQTYYDAYLSMHESFINDLGMDFGGISVVRQHKNGVSPEASRSLTIARNAQYKLCSDLDNLFMLSAISETVTLDMMDPTLTSHYSQKTFNMMGTEMASNLAISIGLYERPEYEGMLLYDINGNIIGNFDNAGVISESAGDGNVFERGDVSNHILARPLNLANNLRVGYKLTINGQDVSEGNVDQFGAFNWAQVQKEYKIKKLIINCVKQ